MWRQRVAAICALNFHPTEPLAFAAIANGSITMWHVPTGELRTTFHGHEEAVYAIAISPDGRHLLSGSADRNLILWEIATDVLAHHCR